MNNIKIFHPYGSVGDIPSAKTAESVDYGSDISADLLIQLNNRIKTFTEGIDEKSSEINNIRNEIKNTKRFVFLGFAYHPQNLKIIKNVGSKEGTKCTSIGTATGISNTDLPRYKNDCGRLLRTYNGTNLIQLKCTELFDELKRSLSFQY